MALTMGDLGKDTKSSLGDGYLYRFDQFALDSRKRTLSRADSPVSLTPKAFDVLLFLAQNPNRLVTKEELLQAVWGDTFVEEGNLKQYISHLRKALGDNSGDTRLIVTIARKGYQFTADVTVAEAVDYPVNDFLTVEDDVAKAVVQQIRLRLTSKQKAALAQSHPVNPEAFDAYLQGHYYFERDSDKDTEMAAKYFERATQLDPSYALAWIGLSRARKWQAVTGLIPTEEGYRVAREAVERALALNPNLAEAHTQMGRIKQQVDFDWAGADASFRRAVELEPGNPESVRLAAFSAAMLGRFDEALQLARRAVDLDPLNAHSWEGLGEIEFRGGKLEEAEADLKKAHELRPDSLLGSTFLSEIYVMQGRPQDALAEIESV
jgi:DNA-binding winged helix-turn-helix (wHTH) protein